ncbi:MAG: hypothetical protein WD249_03985 [Gaiellaceae bacterium]
MELEPDRALTGDQVEVVEWMDVRQMLRLDELTCPGIRLVPDRPVEDDVGSVAFRCGDLRGRRVLGHDDDRADSEHRRGERHALGMVAGGRADDATGALLL